MMNEQVTRITIQVRKDLKDGFTAFTRKFGISKDHFLRSHLPREIEHLKQLPPNSAKGKNINRMLGGGTERLNISLTTGLAEELDRVCKEKGLHREIFLHYYLDYLLNGDDEFEFPSPIERLEELLENPRLGYSTEKFGNPYRHLYWTEESADVYMKMVKGEI